MTGSVSFVTAFVAGVISFLSPCVLPLIPVYLTFVSGVSLETLRAGQTKGLVRQVTIRTAWFVLGFTIVFTVMGATATGVGAFLSQKAQVLLRVAGVVLIAFGLHTAGLFTIPFLNLEKRLQMRGKVLGPGGAVVAGMAFGFGWSPCIGPILAGILALAAQAESVTRGMALLVAYSAGLGIPFLLTGLGINQFFKAFASVRGHFRAIELTSGLLLVAVGVLLATNRLSQVSQWFSFLSDWVFQLETKVAG